MLYSELITAIKDYCQNSETTFNNHLNDFILAAENKIFSAVELPSHWRSVADTVLVDGTPEYNLGAGVVQVESVRVSESVTSAQAGGVEFGPVRYLLLKDYDFLLEAYPGSATAASEGVPKYYSISSTSVAGGSATITGITRATEAVVSANNTFSNGDNVLIAGVSGMTEVNGNYYVVSDRSGSSFKLKDTSDSYIDSSGFTAYSSGGTARTNNPDLTIRLAPEPDLAYRMTVTYLGKAASDSITNGSIASNETWLSVTFPDCLLWGSVVEAYTFMKGEPDLMQTYEKRFLDGMTLLKHTVETRSDSDAYRPASAMPTPQG